MPALEYPVTTPAAFSVRCHAPLLSSELLDPLRNQIDRQRKNDRRVFLHANFRQGLQITKLNGGGLFFQNSRGLRQLCRSFKFTLGMNNLRSALPLGFRLAGN